VDGNDALAMYVATKEAMERARKGGGPTLIEAYTYRRADHTTSDDAAKYRTEEEVKAWEKKDPIDRFRVYLKTLGFWNENFEQRVQKEAELMADEAVKDAESTPSPAIEELFRHTYSDMPQNLKEQLAELKSVLGKDGK